MRGLSFSKVAVPVGRALHTRTPAPRPQRWFHQTTLASMPRQRTFFTSNHLLSNGEKHPDEDPEKLHTDTLTSRLPSRQPVSAGKIAAPSKRKPTRAAVSKSLRLGTALKTPPKRGTSPSSTTTPSHVGSEERDYRNTISAICVAQFFDMDVVQEILRFHAFELDPDGTDFESDAVVHARGFNSGDIFVFPSGTVVSWGVPTETLEALATTQLIRAAEGPHADRHEMEELDFVTDDGRDTSYMKGEVVVLGTRSQGAGRDSLDTTLAKIAFSSGLARSPKLAVLENNLIEYFDSSKTILNVPAGVSDSKLSSKYLLKKTGELLSLRSQLNHYSDITDQLPDMFWDKESRLEEYYNRIGAALDIKARIHILNSKIDYAHEAISILREMNSEQHSTRLEWIIIFLIAIEVLFELRRVYKEEWGDQKEESQHEKSG